MWFYSSMVAQKKKIADKVKSRDGKSRRKPLAPLPKDPWKRFWAHFRWERIKAYWFSMDGLKRIGKIFAACVLIGIIGVGALFVYYKNQLKEIQLNDLTISETVNTYLDRNGVVLWEDKGESDYRLVVDGDQISTYVRQATVAIEDRKFYTHPGIDISGLMRAVISTLTGKGVQGGSTLTQQLIKQIYFSDEAASANRGGLSRKIKELILAIELEKMYSKEQIITMYLNESPYGGRRNGIESAAQTYFGKSAKDLNLAESALLAAIPNNPAIYNPYYEPGNEKLIERQHKVLNDMVEMGYITDEEAEEAKAVPILDQILPESHQYTNMKAPHFVMEVKSLLEKKYGIQTMRTGGFTIKTTLDYRAQEMAEKAVAAGNAIKHTNGTDNIAMVSMDVETSQIIAMVGSIDWNTPVYGEVNAATSLLEPGSTIKPVLDYAPLFSMTGDTIYGPGTILKDENIDDIYCAGYTGSCALRNASGAFNGDLTIRQTLGNSLNIGAVKALKIVGIENGLEMAHKLGDKSYCAQGNTAGLSMAIGSGCGVIMTEHANAYATIARGGTYKDMAYVLELKDSTGKVLESWQDLAGEEVLDPQVAYELSSILSDVEARRITFMGQSNSYGFVVPGVWTASKTGTTTTANAAVGKDLWMMSYSTAVVTAVWNGNHDGRGASVASNNVVRRVVAEYMEPVHKELYASEGKWKAGDQPIQPAGIQTATVLGRTDIWPSWFNQDKSGVKKETVEFNASNHKRASVCTPDNLKISVDVSIFVDPVSGKETVSAPDGYLYSEEDDCAPDPNANYVAFVPTKNSEGKVTMLTISFIEKEYELASYELLVDGEVVKTETITPRILENGITYTPSSSDRLVTVILKDVMGHQYQFPYRLE